LIRFAAFSWSAASSFVLRQLLPDILAKRTDLLSPRMVRIVSDLADDWRQLDDRIETVTDEIEAPRLKDAAHFFPGTPHNYRCNATLELMISWIVPAPGSLFGPIRDVECGLRFWITKKIGSSSRERPIVASK
jgi:hypothetical protein